MSDNDKEILNFFDETLEELDPGGQRPVFRFGHNGGVAYFLARPDPSPISYGFTLSIVHPDKAVQDILNSEAPYFLIYDRIYESWGVPVKTIRLGSWDQETTISHYITKDLPYFNAIRDQCIQVAETTDEGIVIYDCA